MAQHLPPLAGALHEVKLADVLDKVVDTAYRELCDILQGLQQDATDADRCVYSYHVHTSCEQSSTIK